MDVVSVPGLQKSLGRFEPMLKHNKLTAHRENCTEKMENDSIICKFSSSCSTFFLRGL